VELITPHRTINYHDTRKGGQGPVWAVAPLIVIILKVTQVHGSGHIRNSICAGITIQLLNSCAAYRQNILIKYVVSNVKSGRND
jgi:hypothetical protein